jgi:hypothetical protein
MSRDFVLRRIAQDAFDPVALTDEVNESGVSSIKHGNEAPVGGAARRDFSFHDLPNPVFWEDIGTAIVR